MEKWAEVRRETERRKEGGKEKHIYSDRNIVQTKKRKKTDRGKKGVRERRKETMEKETQT